MIIIVCALQCEARVLARALHLKPVRTPSLVDKRLEIFEGSEVILGVSGIGKIASATATAALVSQYNTGHETIFANMGLCAASPAFCEIGDIFFVNAVMDMSSERKHFPDILLKHGLKEAKLYTSDSPVSDAGDRRGLFDMEGSGFIEAAQTFVAPHRSFLLKVVSDYCSPQSFEIAAASKFFENRFADIVSVLALYQTSYSKRPEQLSAEDRSRIEKIGHVLKLTVSERNKLDQDAQSYKARGGKDLEKLLNIEQGKTFRILKDQLTGIIHE